MKSNIKLEDNEHIVKVFLRKMLANTCKHIMVSVSGQIVIAYFNVLFNFLSLINRKQCLSSVSYIHIISSIFTSKKTYSLTHIYFEYKSTHQNKRMAESWIDIRMLLKLFLFYIAKTIAVPFLNAFHVYNDDSVFTICFLWRYFLVHEFKLSPFVINWHITVNAI